MNSLEQEISELEQKLHALDAERVTVAQTLATLRQRRQEQIESFSQRVANATVTHQSSRQDKIKLFRDLFKGREDVYPKRFESSKTGKTGYSPVCLNEWHPTLCHKPRIKCGDCQYRAYQSLTDAVITNHLMGAGNPAKPHEDYVIGVYPLLQDERCWFLAVDFDKASWQQDVSAFSAVCKVEKVHFSIERSRSGKGAHVWVFFSTPVPAIEARKLGSYLLTLAMDQYPELGFESYDRLFPNQDTMPKGGLGNLIALPLQKKARERGNSEFIDEHFVTYPDQWAYLSTIKRISLFELRFWLDKAEQQNKILGVKLPMEEDDSQPWNLTPSRKLKEVAIDASLLPKQLEIVLGNQLFIDKLTLPAALQTRLLRLAAFQNPEFYKAQAMRLSTHDKPRIISCAELFSQHIALPRGCLEDLLSLMKELNIQAVLRDDRYSGELLPDVQFQGALTEEQIPATIQLLQYDIGTLSATTAFGKTVVALYVLAQRQVNTLIIVHRRQLLDQWLERIAMFLNVPKKQVGKIGGGRNKPTGVIDVAIMQSLTKNHEVDDLVANYGLVIFDECHHLSAKSFEKVANACKAKCVLGLSATLTRKDGHHPIVFMQCGPIRYQVSAKQQALARPFDHVVIQRFTEFTVSKIPESQGQIAIHAIYQALMEDEARNQLILADIQQALSGGRSPIVLTERKEHVSLLVERIRAFTPNVFEMQGGMGAKLRKQLLSEIDAVPDNQPRVIVATGRYLGEGFDDARLDTLFLAIPISWKGTLAQYVGRLHRLHHAKTEVRIYDYVDAQVPMLSKMSERRKVGYRSLGYKMIDS
ncbi:DEAD/DEAH box helicase [Methylomonas sp. LW13]|uniref:TOTE conflict system archaeo-eukaryotic primase domain-containing protein n=1 Tax=unclassified Methylomonas TaxID=2608980 RepID=UPI00051ACDF3|nr:DEAD/DEAH box helicase [Methylomonas sp. LW13]QBC28778.1 DEAD/DEAH box helicase [Methylomonas sp. LW13]